MCQFDIVVFEYQKQVTFNTTAFDGGPSVSHRHLLLVSKQKNVVFGILNASRFSIGRFFEGEGRCQTKSYDERSQVAHRNATFEKWSSSRVGRW
jgi:hypothetical protein